MFDGFKRLFRMNREGREWEMMPRIGSSFAEKQVAAFHDSFGNIDVQRVNRAQVLLLAEDVASNACAPDVPTLYALEGRACCFFRTEAAPEDFSGFLSTSIEAGKTMLLPSYIRFPTYPVLSLLFQMPTDGDFLRVEAAPDLASADIRDVLDILLETGTGDLYFFCGEPPRLVAKGEFSVLKKELRRCLEKAAKHYKSIDSASLNYIVAVQAYFASTEL